MLNICNDVGLVAILSTFQKIMTTIQIITPIVLLVMASVQLTKLVIDPDRKNGIKNIKNMINAAVVVFFIPIIVNAFMSICSSSIDFASCYQAARTASHTPSTKYISIEDEEKQRFFDTNYEKGVKKNNNNNNNNHNYNKDVESFMMAVKETVQYAKTHNYHYGNSTALPPTTDKKISCDRLASKALWDIGYTDQRKGGEVVSTLDSYLTSHGWIKSTNINDCRYGSIVLVSHSGTRGSPYHAFVVESYKNGVMKTYDEGAEWRITANQPFTMGWTQSLIYGVYNMN